MTVSGSTATITAAGTYVIQGSLADGQILVDAKGLVTLVLNGAHIRSATTSPIFIKAAKEAVVILADGTENYLSDASTRVFEDPDEDEPNATLFSKDDLTITGGGALVIAANYNDGIASKDQLVITGGNITVNAVDDGIRGKDYLQISDATISITAQGDGLKSDRENDPALGYIAIASGLFRITAGGDGIQAVTDVRIAGGEFVITTGGGSGARLPNDLSAKGIKAGVKVVIDGGTFTIDAADDAIHSNDAIVINRGTFELYTGDDAMHADNTLEVNGGDIRIKTSYEGIESQIITVNAGDIHIVSRDDGINTAGGAAVAGMNPRMGFGGAPGGRGGAVATGNYHLYINGGNIVIYAGGDGIDSNGPIDMTDGLVIVHGPTERMNGALDYGGYFNISGGMVIAAGSSGMCQAPGDPSSQNSLLLNMNSTLQGGTLIHIRAADGAPVLTFAPAKAYQSLAFSSPSLVRGATYQVWVGGSSSGVETEGLYQGGDYSGGSQLASFTISGVLTRLGSTGGFR